jgi:alanine-glyoxylate transaminase/serine-glyoxylate transaminase/serine-pyruvate transaminase
VKHRPGRHFLQIPGPTNVPDRVLRAIDRATIDHRGPEFAELGKEVLEGCRGLFRTSGPVMIFPSSGTGAWESGVVNTLSPGDRVLMYETGQFAVLWQQMCRRWKLDVAFVPGDWRHGVDPADVERRLREDRDHAFRAVMIVHNETATGVTSRVAEVRRAIDKANHPALFMVDTISSVGSLPYEHDGWGVDVTIGGSQKGMMLPPGLSFVAVSRKALAAGQSNSMPRSYWDWSEMLKSNEEGFFPYTPATSLLYGLREALLLMREEGLEQIFARHHRLAEATRAAVRQWGLEIQALDPAEYSDTVTAVRMPAGHDADRFRAVALELYDISLGMGLGKTKGKVFRIGHLGDLNDLTLIGALAGVEMGLRAAGVPYRAGGVQAAMDSLATKAAASREEAVPASSGR